MSAPSPDLKRSEYIDFGFLSVKASEALKVVLAGKKITAEQTIILAEAADFLKDIATGAGFIATGAVPGGFSPSRSMDALDYAMGPVRALRKLIDNDDVAKFFKSLTEAVKHASGGNAVKSKTDRKFQKAAISFFEALYQSIVAELSVKYPVLGSRPPRYGIHAH
jgi:hypothetical protein